MPSGWLRKVGQQEPLVGSVVSAATPAPAYALRTPSGLTEMSDTVLHTQGVLPYFTPCLEFGVAQTPACHAGLAAYSSWVPTVKLLLQSSDTPCCFTDYCEEAADRAADMCRALMSSSRPVEVALNPWRSPLRDLRAGTALPSCSNAFVISVA